MTMNAKKAHYIKYICNKTCYNNARLFILFFEISKAVIEYFAKEIITIVLAESNEISENLQYEDINT